MNMIDLADVTAKYREIFHDKIIGERISHLWTPVRVKLDKAEVRSDFPSLPSGSPLVFNKKALLLLEPLIENFIEALPLISESGEEFYAINVLTTLDCLDVERSEVERFRSGRIMRIEKYAFHDSILRESVAPIFKIPEMRNVFFYVTDDFKYLMEHHNLKGLHLWKAYSCF